MARRCAIATRHDPDMVGYEHGDCESGPLASLMGMGLHAVELGGAGPPVSPAPGAVS